MSSRILNKLVQDQFGLPATRHIPGSGSVPSLDFLQQISANCPHRTLSIDWSANSVYRYGWHLFLHGYYWESHEVWEAVWMRCAVNSRERMLLQAIIQLANARLKLIQGKHTAFNRILSRSNELVAEAFRALPDEYGDLLMGLKQNDLLELNQDQAL